MSGEEFWRTRGAGWMQSLVPDRAYAWRDRLIASPRFQRFAATFPLTRAVAHTQARSAFDLCAGFVYSQVLFACVELRLIEMLAQGPRTLSELSGQTGLAPEPMMRLLRAAVALGILNERGHRDGGPNEQRDPRFGLGMQGAAIAGNPSIALMVQHHAMLYRDLADPISLLKGQATSRQLASYWPYATAKSPSNLANDEVAGYSRLMSASQALIAGDIVDAYDFGRHTVHLDVGGGEGTFLQSVAARHPSLRLMLFDLPAVAARAQTLFDEAGLSARATIHGGSFRQDPLPPGADVISLVRIVHDHDDDVVMALLRATYAALPTNGVLLIAEPMAGVRGAEPMADAYFGFYLLAMGSGRARTADELQAMVRASGFQSVRKQKTARPMLTGLVVARRL
jgi:demethylspheroidene O-methyltransferase